MKQILLAILLAGTAYSAHSQYLEFDAKKIPVYERPFALKTSAETPVDTISQNLDNDEEWYDFTILESSGLRFRIRYRLSDDCMLGQRSDSKPLKEGWIDKKYMRVRFSGKRNDKNADCFDFRLYASPDDEKPENVFTFYQFEKESVDLPILEIGENGWLKVMFFLRGKYYEGWTRDYCNLFYTTCT